MFDELKGCFTDEFIQGFYIHKDDVDSMFGINSFANNIFSESLYINGIKGHNYAIKSELLDYFKVIHDEYNQEYIVDKFYCRYNPPDSQIFQEETQGYQSNYVLVFKTVFEKIVSDKLYSTGLAHRCLERSGIPNHELVFEYFITEINTERFWSLKDSPNFQFISVERRNQQYRYLYISLKFKIHIHKTVDDVSEIKEIIDTKFKCYFDSYHGIPKHLRQHCTVPEQGSIYANEGGNPEDFQNPKAVFVEHYPKPLVCVSDEEDCEPENVLLYSIEENPDSSELILDGKVISVDSTKPRLSKNRHNKRESLVNDSFSIHDVTEEDLIDIFEEEEEFEEEDEEEFVIPNVFTMCSESSESSESFESDDDPMYLFKISLGDEGIDQRTDWERDAMYERDNCPTQSKCQSQKHPIPIYNDLSPILFSSESDDENEIIPTICNVSQGSSDCG